MTIDQARCRLLFHLRTDGWTQHKHKDALDKDSAEFLQCIEDLIDAKLADYQRKPFRMD